MHQYGGSFLKQAILGHTESVLFDTQCTTGIRITPLPYSLYWSAVELKSRSPFWSYYTAELPSADISDVVKHEFNVYTF
jgi:hypothetical protein